MDLLYVLHLIKDVLIFLTHPAFAVGMLVIYNMKVCMIYANKNRPHERGFE